MSYRRPDPRSNLARTEPDYSDRIDPRAPLRDESRKRPRNEDYTHVPQPPPLRPRNDYYSPTRGKPNPEYRIVVDVSQFPPDMNLITQILGYRGKHQQRMKAESDAVVTLIGKGVRGSPNPDEPMTVMCKSKAAGQSLTRRQIAVIQAIYDELVRQIKQFGTSDGLGAVAIPNSGPPESLVEFLWFIHQLLITSRAADLKVEELYAAYKEHYSHDCPLQRWLVIDDNGLIGALSRIPHVVDFYRDLGDEDGPLYLRASNPPEITFVAFRELDDAYKAKLNDLSRPASIATPGQEEKHANLVTLVQAIQKLLVERAGPLGGSIPVEALPLEFSDLYKSPLDVNDLFQEPSLLKFLQKFPSLFQVSYDGNSWRVAVSSTPSVPSAYGDANDVDIAVHHMLLQSRTTRTIVRIAHLIPLNGKGNQGLTTAGAEQVTSLVQILQSLQKQPGHAAPVREPVKAMPPKEIPIVLDHPSTAASGASVTSQIQALLKKKKDGEASQPSSSNALSGLLAALRK